MALIPVPVEPWRFAGGRVWLDDVVAKDQEETLQYLEGCISDPIDDSRKVDEKTEAYRRYARRLWDMFCKNVLSKADTDAGTADPEAIALDLCHNRPSAENKFRAFLRHYVKTSVQLRPSLGPEEYRWIRGVDSAITVTELWKALVREFDSGFLQEKRRKEPERASIYSLRFSDTSQGSGSVWKISKWIREDLADDQCLSRGQLFHKQEVTGEDALAILTVLWTRPDIVKCSPTDRLTFHFMVLLASIGAFRPGSLSCILYHQVQLAVVAHRNSRRLVATITIVHNKSDKNALKRSQDDRISFSVTFAPCPLVCVLSLLVAKAIKDDAFDVGFDSLNDLLTRPTLGDSAYLPIHWKKDLLDKPMFQMSYHRLWEIWQLCTWALGCRDPPRPYAMRVGGAGRLDGVLTPAVRNFVVDNSSEVFERSYLPNHFRGQLATFAFGALAGDYESLFRQLCNSSLKVDQNAPMNVSAEEKTAFEQRSDLRVINGKLAGDGKGESPGWREDLQSRASYIRNSLAKQLKVQKRSEYFERVDRQRALGFTCAPPTVKAETLAIEAESLPCQGATSIGAIFQHFSATKELLLATLKSYSETMVAYLRLQPASVAHLAYATIRDTASPNADTASMTLPFEEPPPRSRPYDSTSWCLLGCGSFYRRPGLNRHMKLHVRDSSFAKPFECPECRRLGWPVSIIENMSHWSAHIHVHHDERDAPNPQLDTRQTSGSSVPEVPAAMMVGCLLCDRNFKPKGISIHYSTHEKDTRWKGPFECPACERLGQNTTTFEGFAAWRKHASAVHRTDGYTLNDEAMRKADKRFRADTDAGSPGKQRKIASLTDQKLDRVAANDQRCRSHDEGDSTSLASSEAKWEDYHAGSKDDPISI